MTIEMTTEKIIEMTMEKKIIGISKTGDIRENIKIIIKKKDNHRTSYKNRDRSKDRGQNKD